MLLAVTLQGNGKHNALGTDAYYERAPLPLFRRKEELQRLQGYSFARKRLHCCSFHVCLEYISEAAFKMGAAGTRAVPPENPDTIHDRMFFLDSFHQRLQVGVSFHGTPG